MNRRKFPLRKQTTRPMGKGSIVKAGFAVGITTGRYKDGREYELMDTWTLNGIRTLRRGEKKNGRWTDWYYDKSNYQTEEN